MARRLRPRCLDLAVALTCVGLVAAPWIMGISTAATSGSRSSVIGSAGTVDQSVASAVTISDPLEVAIGMRPSRTKLSGQVVWTVSSNAVKGAKLAVSTVRTPAMRDPQAGTDVADYETAASSWSVGSGQGRFGFSVVGDPQFVREDEFRSGVRWRGFAGPTAIEVGRRWAPLPPVRTAVKFQAQFASAVRRDARPGAVIEATAVGNI